MSQHSDDEPQGGLVPIGEQSLELDSRRLTAAEFLQLAEVPPELEWFADIDNPNTRRAYQRDVGEFMEFAGIQQPEDFRLVTRAHVIAWRKTFLERKLKPSTIRRKLAALSSLFNRLTEHNAVAMNPVKGIKRPNEDANEGKTPAIGDGQALSLLEMPDTKTLVGKRDVSILSTIEYHGLRRSEVSSLLVGDVHEREGVMHLRVSGKGNKTRYLVLATATLRRIREYLEAAGHRDDKDGPLYRPVRNNRTGELRKALDPDMIRRIVVRYSKLAGVNEGNGVSPHSLRATAATNALEGGADVIKVQKWLGHASVATTTLYDKRGERPEDSPTLKVNYRRRKNERSD